MRLTIVSLLVTLASLGCNQRDLPPTARDALRDADKFEILSLDPDHAKYGQPGNFHGWKVLGRTTIDDAATREKLTAALRKGVRDNDGMVAGCFNPRHGIVVTKGGQATEFVICFECMSMQIHRPGQKAEQVLTTASPQPTFDAALKAKGVALGGKGG